MIAQTPPMGWNSWDCYGAAVDEKTVRQNASYMAEHLLPYGWDTIVVDIQWAAPGAVNHEYEPFGKLCMDAYGRLQPAENRFPSAKDGAGFKPLADFVHSLGLKFGIHIMRGLPRVAAHSRLPIFGSSHRCDEAALSNSVCMWNPDMYGLKCDPKPGEENLGEAYYNSIFRMYAAWGVDFVKCDDIAREYPQCEKEIETISKAARSCGRDIVLSLSPGPAPLEKAEHLKKYANMWRITDDFWDAWPQLLAMFDRAEKWCIHAGPGHWPDADMLPIGALRQCDNPNDWTRFTEAEITTMMSLWCLMRSPLMIGGELTKMDTFSLSRLQNADVLAISQTTAGAHPLYRTDDACVWVAPESNGSALYVGLFNLSDSVQTISVDEELIEKPVHKARELWTGAVLDSIVSSLPAHGAAIWKVE